ncbi:ADP-forming succinate--CoA ligase subunit beta [Natranaerobius thermophilus]|uniref:Succinate--CoA ligase [ADP-forming] subunit beta n=1 Tax=Natranaerobius thermophilus (strain ATCC BAA-1301 / DSM 18059 / JW/NM-WN-LF) TaxID=457570 RepID=B2A0T1_NATTJ|nr:ADP-forming succinate--CoA ligase subunit beta [Natranaerobius thermophilus]ACB85961.1 succinyl-CoA synthetase, beta subunit [Natranaerobius thermophilus JW/NM-WN-LF]
MKLYEYMAKKLMNQCGISVPRGEAAFSAQEVEQKFTGLDSPAVIKSQVLVGGRGKAGGIKFADTPQEARKVSKELFNMQIKGEQVTGVLVEEQLDISSELYLSITVDTGTKKPLIMASTQGGVDIEEVSDDLIVKRHIEPDWGVLPYLCREITDQLNLPGEASKQVSAIISKLYDTFKTYDAELVEINPLVITEDNRVIAADGKMTIDDDAMYRQDELPRVSEKTSLEQQVEKIGLSFVELEGDIAIMANGAGMAMATVDVIEQYGGKAANFLDAGGGASVEPTKKALELLLNTDPRAVIINIFGGITRCDDVANALVQVKQDMGIKVPLVIRLIGTKDEEAVKILGQHGISAYQDMGEAAKKAVELAAEGGVGV